MTDCISNNIPFSIGIVGHNRTRMTIENLKLLMQYIKYPNIKFFIGSDRSRNGHIKAIDAFMKTTSYQYECIETTSDRYGLGAIMNMVCEKVFEFSQYIMLIENDMLIHRPLDVIPYIEILNNTNVGCVSFKCYSEQMHKCKSSFYEINGNKYCIPIPLTSESYAIDFGQNILSKRLYEKLGKFIENTNETDMVEKTFAMAYVKQLQEPTSIIKVIPYEYLHDMMNDNKGVFYHVGIHSQHSNAVWNPTLIPQCYHNL